ncbi:MAG: methyltransferase domain-containing protein [Chitinophagaceae bacterium]
MTTLYKHTVKWDFETIYVQLRQKESRIYTDEELSRLPNISHSHIHYREWLLRKNSAQKLVTHLKKKKKVLDILEIGCGNGWFSRKLSDIPGSRVIGTDINFSEIQQAASVFQNVPNLHFMYADAEQEVFKEKKFDTIVFAASIQYFESLSETITGTLKLLKPGGEIHIIDSPFYSLAELRAARLRTNHYYESVGFPEMADCYFHHCYGDLENYNYSILYNPKAIFNKFLRNKNPFPWISIQPINS